MSCPVTTELIEKETTPTDGLSGASASNSEETEGNGIIGTVKQLDAMAGSILNLNGPEGILVGTAAVVVMYHLLRNAMSSPGGDRVSPALVLALGLPAWPIPLLLLTFLTLQPHLPRFFRFLQPGGLIAGDALEALFLPLRKRKSGESGAWWKDALRGLHVLVSLAAWAVLHMFFSRAVQKHFSS